MFYPVVQCLTKQELLLRLEFAIQSIPLTDISIAPDAIATGLRYTRLPNKSPYSSVPCVELTIPVNWQLNETRKRYCWVLAELSTNHLDKQTLSMHTLLSSRHHEITDEVWEILATSGLADNVEKIEAAIPDDIRHATSAECYRIELKIWLKARANILRAA